MTPGYSIIRVAIPPVKLAKASQPLGIPPTHCKHIHMPGDRGR